VSERIKLPEGIDCEAGASLEFTDGKWWIVAKNQGGYDRTMVDLTALLTWLRENRPDLLKAP